MINVKTFPLGPLKAQSFLAWEEGSKDGVIFDFGGSDTASLEKEIKANELTIDTIIFTHGHYDHIGGINRAKELFPNATIYIGEHENDFLNDSGLNLSAFIDGSDFSFTKERTTLKEGDIVKGFEVIHTPGHTKGSICLYNKEHGIVFTGDTLFKGSYGRTDFPTGNMNELRESLAKLCNNLPNNTIVYNGHMAPTTIEDEKMNLKYNNII